MLENECCDAFFMIPTFSSILDGIIEIELLV